MSLASDSYLVCILLHSNLYEQTLHFTSSYVKRGQKMYASFLPSPPILYNQFHSSLSLMKCPDPFRWLIICLWNSLTERLALYIIRTIKLALYWSKALLCVLRPRTLLFISFIWHSHIRAMIITRGLIDRYKGSYYRVLTVEFDVFNYT
jgi:hypothetical protein